MSSGAYPNAGAIISYLMKEGYSLASAAGIYGNIYQESAGNPEAIEGGGGGGEGLIQWTGTTPYPNANIITGNSSTDLETQLPDILAWAKANNASPSVMNAAVGDSPTTAAEYFETNAERAGQPDMSNRTNAAAAVYQLGSTGQLSDVLNQYKLAGPAGPSISDPGISASTAVQAFQWITNPVAGALGATVGAGDALTAIGKEFVSLGKFFDHLVMPETWIRLGAVLGGGILFIVGFMVLMHTDTAIKDAAPLAAMAAVL